MWKIIETSSKFLKSRSRGEENTCLNCTGVQSFKDVCNISYFQACYCQELCKKCCSDFLSQKTKNRKEPKKKERKQKEFRLKKSKMSATQEFFHRYFFRYGVKMEDIYAYCSRIGINTFLSDLKLDFKRLGNYSVNPDNVVKIFYSCNREKYSSSELLKRFQNYIKIYLRQCDECIRLECRVELGKIKRKRTSKELIDTDCNNRVSEENGEVADLSISEQNNKPDEDNSINKGSSKEDEKSVEKTTDREKEHSNEAQNYKGEEGYIPQNYVEVIEAPAAETTSGHPLTSFSSVDYTMKTKDKDAGIYVDESVSEADNTDVNNAAPPYSEPERPTDLPTAPPPVPAAPPERIMRCKAVVDYEGTCDKELTFFKGQIIRILRKSECDDDCWWEGEMDGKIGLFPCFYVSELKENRESITPMSPCNREEKIDWFLKN